MEDYHDERIYRYKHDLNIFKLWKCCFYFHALFLECPGIIIETIIKVTYYLPIGILLLIIGYLTSYELYQTQGKRYLREVLLYISFGISICIPFFILFIYKKFHIYDEWNISPLPTILGYIDPRRYWVLISSNCQDAKNRDYDQFIGSMDTFGNEILHPYYIKKNIKKYQKKLNENDINDVNDEGEEEDEVYIKNNIEIEMKLFDKI